MMSGWLAGLVVMLGGVVGPTDGPTIPTGLTRVEEDWEVIVADPDVTACGPQITTVMGPLQDSSQIALTFNLNYRDDPFDAGGMQLRLWANKRVLLGKEAETQQLETASERIAWTQMMDLSGNLLTLQVKNGTSTTWGNFAEGDSLKLLATTSLTNLDGYRLDETLANSGCGWQSNRLTSMKLLRVRYYVNGVLAATDETPKVIVSAATGN